MLPSTVYCDNCGAANRPQARFCVACGQAMPGASPLPPTVLAGPTLAASSPAPTGSLTSRTLLKQRYLIISRLGQGGMGAVYKAQDTQLGDRPVAVKEMSQRGLDPQELTEAADAFKREALMLARLFHRHLPRIYDHFADGGRWYLVMDFIEGETLEEHLAKAGGRLPVEEVLDIGIQLCTVLGYLHSHQPPIIFRDLKPSNVMRAAEGDLFLIDFGIARHFKAGQAKDTAAYGSAGYSAPEQYGKAQTTPQSDIYGLGATLHQLLSGSDPSHTPFRFASLTSVGMPVELATLIAQMVDMDVDKRPSNMTTVKQEMQRIQQLATPTAGSQLPPTQQIGTGSPLNGSQINLGTKSREQLIVETLRTLQASQKMKKIYLRPEIPTTKLVNARDTCKVPTKEEILGLIDCSVFGSAKNCILFGIRAIYYHQTSTAPGMIAYSDFPSRTFTVSRALYVITNSGEKIHVSGSNVSTRELCDILNALKKSFSA